MPDLEDRGWAVFAPHAALTAWVSATNTWLDGYFAEDQNRGEWRHGGTWFPGVNLLPNDEAGALPDGPPLTGAASDAVLAGEDAARHRWDRAQISICRPGYPKRDPGESEAAHRYRARRDAAHLDGLLPVGADRRRHMRERHGAILGLPLNTADPEAAPFVIYEGSHKIMKDMLTGALAHLAPARWADTDITDVYQAARREVFATCQRCTVHVPPGAAYVVHRFALHGVAPWAAPAAGDRRIAYFRPETTRDPRDWLEGP